MRTNRVLHKDNAVYRDLSASLSDLMSGTETIAVVAAEDALYLGSELPFNHRFFYLGTANDVASVMSVSIWDGDEWVPAVDVIDETSVGGVTLARSGVLSWATDRDAGWVMEATTEDMGADLNTLKIYDKYWAKISFTSDLKATTSLKYVGQLFCNDADLTGQYPNLAKSALKTAFSAGKTDWVDQNILAAQYVADNLKQRHVIYSKDQILEREQFRLAAVHKAAAIIFNACGPDFEKIVIKAEADFKKAMPTTLFKIDLNNTGNVEPAESFASHEYLSR